MLSSLLTSLKMACSSPMIRKYSKNSESSHKIIVRDHVGLLYRVLMLVPFYLINVDWAIVKCLLVYFEMESAHDLTKILLFWVD